MTFTFPVEDVNSFYMIYKISFFLQQGGVSKQKRIFEKYGKYF